VSIVSGLFLPVILTANVWRICLAAYVLVAAGVPVWLFLQSRDFINVHILYAGVLMLFVTLITASLRGRGVGHEDVLPALDLASGTAKLGGLWPGLFITIACGAVSGFHSLCAGGTTCKQLKKETATRYLGYWGMLLETLLAVCVIGIVMVGTTRAFYYEDVFPAGKDNNPVLGFAFAVGRSAHAAYGLPIAAGALAGMLLLEGFVITTLDTAVRLNRYLIEEVWQEFFGRYDARFYWVSSGLAVGLMLWLAFSGSILQLWKIFGTANQLLAAFVLGIGAIWLLRNGRKVWYVVAPAAFMVVTTFASLVVLFGKFLPRGAAGARVGNPTLFGADLVLLVLTAYLVAAGIRELLALRRVADGNAGGR
jgi:carbon starvation protein